jgi:hypothetical protein
MAAGGILLTGDASVIAVASVIRGPEAAARSVYTPALLTYALAVVSLFSGQSAALIGAKHEIRELRAELPKGRRVQAVDL